MRTKQYYSRKIQEISSKLKVYLFAVKKEVFMHIYFMINLELMGKYML
jgi:hypothetical protein